MKTITIKNKVLGDLTNINVVGIIDTSISNSQIKTFADSGVDIFEIRADLFNKPIDHVTDYINNVVKTSAPTAPLIGTLRECANIKGDRVNEYISLAQHVDIIDIELGMQKSRDIVDAVSAHTCIMVSEHDFEKTPTVPELDDIVKRSLDQGAQIVKIATTANSFKDVTRLLRYTEDCDMPLVTMAMGDIGRITRLAAPCFGSLFVYGYLRKPLVSGQLSVGEILQFKI